MYSCTALGQEPLGIFSGHLNSTFYVKAALSPNDMYLMSGSSDNDAYIWNVTDPSAAPILLKGHLGEVTSVAWCPSDQGTVCTRLSLLQTIILCKLSTLPQKVPFSESIPSCLESVILCVENSM